MALAFLVVLGAVLVLWGWRGGSVAADVPAATAAPAPAAPTAESAVAATATPDAQPTPDDPTATTAPRAKVPAAGTAYPTPEPAAATATAEIGRHEPVHVVITRAGEVLVDAPVALTQLNDRDELNPPSGVVGWYGPPQWSTVPGELSDHPAVLAGHTSYDGVRDVFSRLGEVRAGDVVTIRYADGQEAEFRVDADALSVPKNDVTAKADAEYAWVWRLAEPGRKVSLFSCDIGAGVDWTGHSHNNWVVQATMIG